MAILTSARVAAVRTTFSAAFIDGFTAQTPVLWNDLATSVPSDGAENLYSWLGQFPQLREWVGPRHIKDLETFDYTIKNKNFEASISVTRDEIEENRALSKAKVVQAMGEQARKHPDQLLFSLIKVGDTTVCYDGQYFFDTDHPVGSTTVSNHGGGSGTKWYLFDTSKALRPFIFQQRRPYEFVVLDDLKSEPMFRKNEIQMGVDARLNVGFGMWQFGYMSKQTLDSDTLNAAIAALMSLKSSEGNSLSVSPTLLVVPPSLRAAASQLVSAPLLASGASNINYQAVRVVIAPELA
jgi:phage major head subunit gpT-like protein